MSIIKVEIPSRLIFQNSINFAKELRAIKSADEYILDFSKLKFIDPFSLLFISSEIQRCRERFINSRFQAINFEHCTYQGHMGFFKAFGVDYGNWPSQAKGSSTYIPINIYNTQDIKNEARNLLINPAELLESKAKEIASILSRSNSGNLNEVLTYCLREIFRNVIEHSQSEQFGFCAQYRQSLNLVSFSIIDRGIGLRESLGANPTLELTNDSSALKAALQPAVSGKIYKGQKKKPKGEWANSGYGLFMTSNICRQGGGFFIASGESGYYLSEKKERILETPFEGTALNLALDTTRIKKLGDMLKEIDDSDLKSKSKPSKSSMGLMNEK